MGDDYAKLVGAGPPAYEVPRAHRFGLVAELRQPVAIVAFASVSALAFFDGGYWPTAWGWAGLALAWTAALALVLREAPRVGRLDIAFVAGLAAVTGWTLASALWSESPGRSVLESQRALVYLAGVGALVVVARRRDYRAVVTALWAALTLIAAYALTTKLLPGRFGGFDSVAGFRLDEPIGYWNALGVACAIGALLALGLAAHSGSTAVRVLAAASLPTVLVAMYFTFSRGAWLALAAGAVALAVFESRRLRIASVGLALAGPVALALVAAYRSEGLTQRGAPLEQAIDAGRSLAIVLALATALSALVAFGLTRVDGRFEPSARLRYALAATLLVATVAAGAFGLVRAGGPVSVAERVRADFSARAESVAAGETANRRLFSLSSNGRTIQWRVARDQFAERPLVGTGAGTYELHWVADRPVAGQVRDAHSLYLETLAELGIVGLALLLFALAVPLAAAFVARRRALVPAAAAAYVAYLAHAAVDWDWELPAVTLAALFCGGAIVLAARSDAPRLSTRARAAGVCAALVVSAFAAVGLLGSSALAAGWDAIERGDLSRALEESETSGRWMPWSSDPHRLAATAAMITEDNQAAREHLRRAIDADPRNWNLWFELAQVSAGPTSERRSRRRCG